MLVVGPYWCLYAAHRAPHGSEKRLKNYDVCKLQKFCVQMEEFLLILRLPLRYTNFMRNFPGSVIRRGLTFHPWPGGCQIWGYKKITPRQHYRLRRRGCLMSRGRLLSGARLASG